MPVAATLKVLVVDDQLSMRQVTRMALEKIGVRLIHEAENGQVALQKATAQPLDLIISDFNMPELDGLGLLRAVRGHPAVASFIFPGASIPWNLCSLRMPSVVLSPTPYRLPSTRFRHRLPFIT